MLAVTHVLQEALQLKPSERIHLVSELIDSLQSEIDSQGSSSLEKDWAHEIERRFKAVLSGEEEAIPWEVVRDEIERDLNKEEEANR